ncbi:MAG: phosphatase PAP2 family protein [Bdellovibrionia bacterium]
MFTKRILPAFILTVPFVILAMLFLDQELAYFFSLPAQEPIYRFAKATTDIALAEFYFALAFGVFVLVKFLQWGYKGNEALVVDRLVFFHRWSINYFVALITSGVLVHLFKNMFGRQRPHLSENFEPYVFSPFNFHWDWHSFPSGHSQVMFTSATMLSIAFPKLRVLWFTAASAIAFTRVLVQYHFVSDVIAGAFVGYAGAHLGIYLLRKTKVTLFQH